MTYNNSYNMLDKIIAKLRSIEMKKNIVLKDKVILDFGCGSNFNKLKMIYKDCKHVIAIDRTGNDFNADKFSYLNYQNSLDILNEKVKKFQFDIIILTAVIEHLEKPEEVLNILKLRLKKDGVIFLTAPAWRAKKILEFMGYKLNIINADLVREHKRYYDKSEYEKLSNLINMKIKKFYFFQFGLNTVCILN